VTHGLRLQIVGDFATARGKLGDIVRAVNRCLIMVYECDRKQPVPERLTQLLAELGHRARAETLVASKRRAADDD
jgi:hypothetical protein